MDENHRAVSMKVSSLVAWGIVLVIGQLLITQWTIHAAGNRDVLDYVSFAGTVVGMLLAVLAIVYSFFAAASQKGDSEVLRAQLESLSLTVQRADLSGKAFEREVYKLSEILDGVGKIRNTVDALQKSTVQQDSNTKKRDEDEAGEGDPVVFKSALLRLAKVPSQWQLLTYAAYCDVKGDRDAFNKRIERLQRKVLAPASDLFAEFMDGQATGFSWGLHDLNLLRDEEFVVVFQRALSAAAVSQIEAIEREADFQFKTVYKRDELIQELREIAKVIPDN